MSCRSVLARLPLFVEGDLPQVDANAVRRHLANCVACRGREAALRESQAWLRDAAASAPAPPFGDADLAAIRASVLRRIERPAPAQIPWWLPFVTALGVLLAILPTQVATTRPPGPPIARATLRQPAPPPSPALPITATAPVTPVTPMTPIAVAARAERPAVKPAPRALRTASAVLPRTTAIADQAEPPSAPELRLELATPNPNVRIIWFVPSTPS